MSRPYTPVFRFDKNEYAAYGCVVGIGHFSQQVRIIGYARHAGHMFMPRPEEEYGILPAMQLP